MGYAQAVIGISTLVSFLDLKIVLKPSILDLLRSNLASLIASKWICRFGNTCFMALKRNTTSSQIRMTNKILGTLI